VPINIDGAMAAVLGEIGFPSDLGNAVFIAARLAGVLAHADEELRTMAPMRRVDPVDHAYRGPDHRELSPGVGASPSTAAGPPPRDEDHA
jgi:citrate synthase